MEWLNILEEVDCVTTYGYPVNEQPVKEDDFLVTAASQIVVENEKTGEQKTFSPHLYQSSMNPDNMVIRTLKLELKEPIEIIAPYEKKKLLPEERITRVEPYVAKIIKPDCMHCTNCGRCSY